MQQWLEGTWMALVLGFWVERLGASGALWAWPSGSPVGVGGQVGLFCRTGGHWLMEDHGGRRPDMSFVGLWENTSRGSLVSGAQYRAGGYCW